MSDTSNPIIHRHIEQRFLNHVQKLLSEDRLRLDTAVGYRSITTLIRDVNRYDHAMDLKRSMSEGGVFDRDVQSAMPVGESVEVTLSQKRFFIFRRTVGRLRIVCASPVQALLKGEEPAPMGTGEVQKLLASLPPSLGGVPQTVVLMSTSGFTREAHALADRTAGRTVVMVETDASGGWTVTGPPEMRDVVELFNPEDEQERRERVRDEIERSKVELLTGGLAVDRLAARIKAPAPLVEAELRAYAKANPGFAAKKLDGRLVLFREGSGPVINALAGGASMPLIERMKALFARKGDEEKKIAFLSERRAALSQQVNGAYEDMGALEEQESQLRQQFKDAAGTITKKRITGQLLQLRKDLERRQQLLGVLNQQINVVSTALHNLELVQQGQTAQLPDTEDMTADAVKAEEMLAELEANAELAGSVAMHTGASGLSAEEQALYEELEAEAEAEAEGTEEQAAQGQAPPTAPHRASASEPPRQHVTPPPLRPEPRRSEPEAS